MNPGPFFHLLDIDGSENGIEGDDTADFIFAMIQISSAANFGLLFFKGITLDSELALKCYSFDEAKPGQSAALIQEIFIV